MRAITQADFVAAMEGFHFVVRDRRARIGEACGVTERQVRRWESGETPVPLAVYRLLRLLAGELGEIDARWQGWRLRGATIYPPWHQQFDLAWFHLLHGTSSESMRRERAMREEIERLRSEIEALRVENAALQAQPRQLRDEPEQVEISFALPCPPPRRMEAPAPGAQQRAARASRRSATADRVMPAWAAERRQKEDRRASG